MGSVGTYFKNVAKGLSQNLQGKSASSANMQPIGGQKKHHVSPASSSESDLTPRSFHKGGTVRKTGLARLKKGERVLTKPQAKKYRKRMSKG
jgi:hypothetical protein